MKKEFLIKYYYEVIQWQILLYVRMIKENKYNYQQEYWLNSLKENLQNRDNYLKKINNYFEPKQLELFYLC